VIYEFRCLGHCASVVEIDKRMNDPSPTTCLRCHGKLERIYSINFHGSCDAAQEMENDGFGKWYPQLGPRYLDAKTKTKRNPDAYARSRADAIDKFKRKGYQSIEKY
jgi:hypothetical protein